MSGENARNGTASTANAAANGTATTRPDRRAREADRQARVVAEFAPRAAIAPSPLAQVQAPETVRQTTINIPAETIRPRREAMDQPVNPWGFSPISVRRTRPRADDAGTDNAGRSGDVAASAFRRQPGSSTTVTTDVDLPPEVRRHLVQIIQGSRRPERVEVTASVDAGPSRMQEVGDGDDGDEPMIIG